VHDDYSPDLILGVPFLSNGQEALLPPHGGLDSSAAHPRRSFAGGRAIRCPDAPNLKLVGDKPRGGDGEHGKNILTHD
jgi:hypothetical protein